MDVRIRVKIAISVQLDVQIKSWVQSDVQICQIPVQVQMDVQTVPSWVLHLDRALPGTVHLANNVDSWDHDRAITPSIGTAHTAFFEIRILQLLLSILHVSEVASATDFLPVQFIPERCLFIPIKYVIHPSGRPIFMD